MTPSSSNSSPRYGIGQWFGLDPRRLPAGELQTVAAQALAGGTRACPFAASIGRPRPCNKAGGVCALRRIGAGGELPDDQFVTTCPSRFLEGGAIFREIGACMLGTSHVRVANELPFLKNANDSSRESASGRIDWIVQDSNDRANWCAVEFQSLYFSGAALDIDMEDYAAGATYPAYPKRRRQPDYRSNGPKRLGPQLGIKVPLLRSWGRQVAVVIDRYFFSCMDAGFTGSDAERRAPIDADHDLGLFVVDYDGTGQIGIVEKFPVMLDVFLRALDSSREMERDEFMNSLEAAMNNPERSIEIRP